IPLSTDAPIYHWPFATVIMIVVNVAIHFVFPEAAQSGFALELGHGLHPLQWVTHNFLHIGLMHLIGNMIFLWAYGITVAGKLGWLRYTALYLAIVTLLGALVQTLCLGMSPLEGPEGEIIYQRALGASAVIFGLLATCMVWAPKNDLNCIVFITFF